MVPRLELLYRIIVGGGLTKIPTLAAPKNDAFALGDVIVTRDPIVVPICLPLVITTIDKMLQNWNAFSPINVTESGIVIDAKLEQP